MFSQGILTTSTESATGQILYDISGAADYVFPSTNKALLEIKEFIHNFSQDALKISDNSAIMEANLSNLSTLVSRLEQERVVSHESLEYLTKHESKNRSSITALTSHITIINSNIHDCQGMIKKLLRLSVIKDHFDPFNAGADLVDKVEDEDLISVDRSNLKLLSSFSSTNR